ncbi:MAG: FecR domain-containing protein [Agriterribacter sp.]
MKHIPQFIQSLVQKYLKGEATPEEKEQIDNWYRSFSVSDVEIFSNETEDEVSDRMKERLAGFIRKDKVPIFLKRNFLFRISAAVVIAGLFAITYYYTLPKHDKIKEVVATNAKSTPEKIIPGGNKAVLTLGDGSTITLDSASNGSLSTQGNTKVIKLGGGQLQYKGNGAHSMTEVMYNTIATPKGGQYKVELADGTNVWLNAASSIKFPTAFTGNKREVEITGEVYFEVAHDKVRPFKVKVKDLNVNVVGTHFDVMAYDNEASINTVLLEGSLRVGDEKNGRMLVPGDKAVANGTGNIKVEKDVDLEETIAWKNGRFFFNSADIHSIMRQVERWYNVDVNFEQEVSLHFTGQLSRTVSVAELLRKLELTNEVHFRINGRTITVFS